VLEYVPRDGLSTEEFRVLLLVREQHYIDMLDSVEHGFNQAPQAGSSLGVKYSPETIAKHAEAHRRLAKDPAWQVRNTAARRNRQRRESFLRAVQYLEQQILAA
jgi:hypothetical protein